MELELCNLSIEGYHEYLVETLGEPEFTKLEGWAWQETWPCGCKWWNDGFKDYWELCGEHRHSL